MFEIILLLLTLFYALQITVFYLAALATPYPVRPGFSIKHPG